MNVPSTRRAVLLFCAWVKSVTFVTVNDGACPWTVRSARFVSPSCLNASFRMNSIRSARFRSLATVKSQAR